MTSGGCPVSAYDLLDAVDDRGHAGVAPSSSGAMTSRSAYLPMDLSSVVGASARALASQSLRQTALVAAALEDLADLASSGASLGAELSPASRADQLAGAATSASSSKEKNIAEQPGVGGVAGDLEGERGLALALRAGEHVEGAGAEAAADALVEELEAGRPDAASSASGARSRASARSSTKVSEVSFRSMARLDRSVD